MKTFFLLLLVAGSASARTLEWTRWYPQYRYVDMELNCSTGKTEGSIYFGVERTASGIRYAEFRDELSEFSRAYSAVPAALLPSIEMDGYVKRVTLSANTLNWMMIHKQPGIWECQPPVPLKEITPGSVTLEFVPTLEEHGKSVWVSNEVKYYGRRTDGMPFQLTLSFRQYRN